MDILHDTHRAPTPGPSNAFTSAIPRGGGGPSIAGPTEQERGLLRYQPNLYEWLYGLESSESFFTDLGKIAQSAPTTMLTMLRGWHDGRPFTPDVGKDPASAGILSEPGVRELLSV